MRSVIRGSLADLLPFPLFSPAADMTSSKDIVSTAESDGQLTILVAALESAGLVCTLRSEGPFTVFAPTDAAFGKLPADLLGTLLKPERRQELAALLTHHVIAGNVQASAVMTTSSVTTLDGRTVSLSLNGGTVKIDGSTIVEADVAASNGTIHVIDTVLLPM